MIAPSLGKPIYTSKFLPNDDDAFIVGSECRFCHQPVPDPMVTPLNLMPDCSAQPKITEHFSFIGENFIPKSPKCVPEIVSFKLGGVLPKELAEK